ncbi:DEAD/DEAH box helicase [Granulicoccus phenolivorans]|uniref:DEAD/DEAH box helicase n=1 Tax=Granulicoccus phenolivorans TaxID=266854 RepID=UPI00068699D6|nr:DEAD/DEAH box helicase [Granulicoccus phenolivorans]
MDNTSFADLGVPAELVEALRGMDRITPFPIQADTLPDTLAGRDVLGRGKTGSGKTLAFAIPLVAGLSGRGGRKPRGLVLAPTRELATQITATIEPLAEAAGLSVTTIFGGVSQSRQETALRRGVDIVVACPGRLDDLMKQGIAHLDQIEITVLDEADHMADLGFLPVVTRILDKTPREGQRMLFSATLDNGVDKLVRKYLADPVLHSVDEANSPVARMTHYVFEVADSEKAALVRTLASGRGRRIMFTRTKHQAKRLAKQLTASGVPAVDLHGNLSQNARDRNLGAFSDGSVRVLVATDVAARGVHVDNVELVVHVDPPVEHKAYLHRSGRTARAGSAGDVATVMLPSQRDDTRQIMRRAKIEVQPQRVTPDAPPVIALVGEPAPYVKPVPGGPGVGNEPAQPQGGGRSRSGRPAGRTGSANRSAGSANRSAGSANRSAGNRRPSSAGQSTGGRDQDAPRSGSSTRTSGRSTGNGRGTGSNRSSGGAAAFSAARRGSGRSRSGR